MFGLMQLAAELDNPFRDSGFGFDKVDELPVCGGTVVGFKHGAFGMLEPINIQICCKNRLAW